MPKLIKLSDIRKLAKLQCTQREAAGWLEISPPTFSKLLRENKRIKEAWEQGQDQGKISLRRKQHNLATTSAPMAIFLGKQYLGQEDKQQLQHTGAKGGPIETMDVSKLGKDERRQLRKLLSHTITRRSRPN